MPKSPLPDRNASPNAQDGPRGETMRSSQARGLRSGQLASLANLPIAVFSAFIVREHVTDDRLIIWLGLFVILIAARFAITAWQVHRAVEPDIQLKSHMAGALTAGLMWGALPVLLVESGEFVDFAFCGFVIAGVTAGALPALCWYRPAYLCYLLGATLPAAAALLLRDEQAYMAMGGMILLYAVVLVLTAGRYSRTVLKTLQLNDDVKRLGRRLVSTQDELALADLEKWHTISHLSHELRTPLNAVLGFSQMIENEVLGPIGNTSYRDYAGDIRKSGASILTLAEELLELSAAKTDSVALMRAPIDCHGLLDTCLSGRNAQAAQARVTMVITLPTRPVSATIDGNKVRLALDNILDNAIRYTPAGGRVAVSVSYGGNDDVIFDIDDTGVGMTPAEIEVALTPFGRLDSPLTHRYSGTGLGLPLARLLTELHGGSLEIESQPDNGTKVTLRIPRHQRWSGEQSPLLDAQRA